MSSEAVQWKCAVKMCSVQCCGEAGAHFIPSSYWGLVAVHQAFAKNLSILFLFLFLVLINALPPNIMANKHFVPIWMYCHTPVNRTEAVVTWIKSFHEISILYKLSVVKFDRKFSLFVYSFRRKKFFPTIPKFSWKFSQKSDFLEVWQTQLFLEARHGLEGEGEGGTLHTQSSCTSPSC